MTNSTQSAAQGELVITRVFDAPREFVWKAWTELERLARWWGPQGFTWVSATLDLRPGGAFHYCMRSPDGHEMWGKFVYREILPPEKLVFTTAFSDAEGNIVSAPFFAVWPLQILNTLTFAEQDRRTVLTLCGAPYEATEAERRAFEENAPSLQQGFKGTFEQLDEYLKSGAGAAS
jgi:uncharacterized protein YndB with AHSA1/START domain